jgi:hypothetical protein
MWVTQTYLGGLEPAAKVFVYHLFEDCGPEQTTFTTRVQSHLDILIRWSGREDLNLRPSAPKADALPG